MTCLRTPVQIAAHILHTSPDICCDVIDGLVFLRCVEIESMASVFGNVLLAALQSANGQCGIKGSGPLRGDEVKHTCPSPCHREIDQGLEEGVHPSCSSTFHHVRTQCLLLRGCISHLDA